MLYHHVKKVQINDGNYFDNISKIMVKNFEFQKIKSKQIDMLLNVIKFAVNSDMNFQCYQLAFYLNYSQNQKFKLSIIDFLIYVLGRCPTLLKEFNSLIMSDNTSFQRFKHFCYIFYKHYCNDSENTNIYCAFENFDQISKEVILSIFTKSYFSDYFEDAKKIFFDDALTLEKKYISDISYDSSKEENLIYNKYKDAIFGKLDSTEDVIELLNSVIHEKANFSFKELMLRILALAKCVSKHISQKNYKGKLNMEMFCKEITKWLKKQDFQPFTPYHLVKVIEYKFKDFKIIDVLQDSNVINMIADKVDFKSEENPDSPNASDNNWILLNNLKFWKESWQKVFFKVFDIKSNWSLKTNLLNTFATQISFFSKNDNKLCKSLLVFLDTYLGYVSDYACEVKEEHKLKEFSIQDIRFVFELYNLKFLYKQDVFKFLKDIYQILKTDHEEQGLRLLLQIASSQFKFLLLDNNDICGIFLESFKNKWYELVVENKMENFMFLTDKTAQYESALELLCELEKGKTLTKINELFFEPKITQLYFGIQENKLSEFLMDIVDQENNKSSSIKNNAFGKFSSEHFFERPLSFNIEMILIT